MTTEEIIKLAQDNGISFTVCFDNGGYSYDGIKGREGDFLKFAEAICEEAYREGFSDGKYEESYMNSMNYLGD